MRLRVCSENAGGGVDQPRAVEELLLHLTQSFEVNAVDDGSTGECAQELRKHVVQDLLPREFPCKIKMNEARSRLASDRSLKVCYDRTLANLESADGLLFKLLY